MALEYCPICGQKYVSEHFRSAYQGKLCSYNNNWRDGYYQIVCNQLDNDLYIHRSIIDPLDKSIGMKELNLIFEFVLHNGSKYKSSENTTEWHFYHSDKTEEEKAGEEYVNINDFLNNYPVKVIDVALRSLVNYSLLYPSFGKEIIPFDANIRACFQYGTLDDHYAGVLKMLTQMGYMTKDPEGDYFTISAEGWKKIEELNRDEQIIKQGFIAMSFKPETKNIREAFRKGITEAGYSVAIIDEKEHNNQIVPEIFFEIERSKFAVVDVTYPNYGAYYEAGYAQALGKQVIICCRKEEFDNDKTRPHFDISQRSMIVWKDEEDLVARLKRRIEATVK